MRFHFPVPSTVMYCSRIRSSSSVHSPFLYWFSGFIFCSKREDRETDLEIRERERDGDYRRKIGAQLVPCFPFLSYALSMSLCFWHFSSLGHSVKHMGLFCHRSPCSFGFCGNSPGVHRFQPRGLKSFMFWQDGMTTTPFLFLCFVIYKFWGRLGWRLHLFNFFVSLYMNAGVDWDDDYFTNKNAAKRIGYVQQSQITYFITSWTLFYSQHHHLIFLVDIIIMSILC